MKPLAKSAPLRAIRFFAVCTAACLWLCPVTVAAQVFTDDLGREIRLAAPPERVVSLVPAITELLFALDAGETVVAVTSHDTWPPAAARLPVVGGFLSPSPERVWAMNPDVVFLSPLHQKIFDRFEGMAAQVICLEAESLSGSYRVIERLGEIFQKGPEAQRLISDITAELDLVRQKTSIIPVHQRLRTIRLMGRDRVMTPGDDSFQNEMIRAAGGVPPEFGLTGSIIPVTREAWQRFNPQVIYGCGGDRKTAERLFGQPGWKDVDAVRHHRIYYFPCALTCRASAHTGYFVSWLAARLYAEQFAAAATQVNADAVLKSAPVAIDPGIPAGAQLVHSRIYDFVNKSLVIRFDAPMRVVSTLEGARNGIRVVGNHYAPPAGWCVGYRGGLNAVRHAVFKVLDLSSNDTAFLFTGADMDHLSIQRRSFRDMTVVALVTAGVKGNAMRMSRDSGRYYEPGTVNIILLTNMRLSPRAMTRAIITATEAKTAALMDMDIRSSFDPAAYRATGTGTDNIIVAEGTGEVIDLTGGHCKMGELIAAAVHAGVLDAVFQQNAIFPARNVFQRLEERGLPLYSLTDGAPCGPALSRREFVAAVEGLLLMPPYAGFMLSAMALGDAHRQGLVPDLSSFRRWALEEAGEIAGRPMAELRPLVKGDHLPAAEAMALNAIFNGVCSRAAATGVAYPLPATRAGRMAGYPNH